MIRQEHNWTSRINYLILIKKIFMWFLLCNCLQTRLCKNSSILEIKFLNSNIVIAVFQNSPCWTRKYIVCYYIYFLNYLLHTFAEQQLKNAIGKHSTCKISCFALFFFPDPQRMCMLGWYKGAFYAPNNEIILKQNTQRTRMWNGFLGISVTYRT